MRKTWHEEATGGSGSEAGKRKGDTAG